MPRYDESTRDFMQKFSEQTPPEQKERGALDPLRTARMVVKGLEDPKKALGKALVRAATKEIMSKEGAVKILDLFSFLNDHYKRGWWDWEPETIWHFLDRDHFNGDGSTPDEIKEAVMALQVCVNTMSPFENWHIFENVANAFNFNPVDFSTLQPPDIDEAALCLNILKKIQPQTAFDPEVLMYVAVCAHSAGMCYLPDDLFFGVQPYLDKITFEYSLRDSTKKAWENKKSSNDEAVSIQISRLKDVKSFIEKGL